MASYRFNFIKAGNCFRPFIPVQLINPATGKFTNVYCLVDTGADASLFPEYIATSTGHNLKGDGVQCVDMIGVMGKEMKCYKHTFKLRIADVSMKNVIWESKEMLFDCADHNRTPPLLGSSDVLHNLSITLNYKNNNFIITV